MSINTKRYDKEKIIHNIPFFSNLNQEEKEIVEKDNTPGKLDGKGKEEDPYIIKSIEDLVYFSKETKEGR